MPDTADAAPSLMARLAGRFRSGAIGAAETKGSVLGQLISLAGFGGPVWTERSYAALAFEGYQRNPVVYRSVRMIAEAAASVTWLAYAGDDELTDHPVLDLLARPNKTQTGADLLEIAFGHLLVSGNAYLEAHTLAGGVQALHALRPDRMRILSASDGWVEGYEYSAGDRVQTYRMPESGAMSPILHLKAFHPTDDHLGLSPMAAAQVSLDIHNAAGAWSKALLDNAARPSGALVYAAEKGNLSRDQFERLKEELAANFTGAANAGRPLLLEGGLDWKAMSHSPRDLDFVDVKNTAARDIALAFGVPPMLLGIPGDATYANYREANRAFWRQTVLPLVKKTGAALAGWLAPVHGDIRLLPDEERIEALTSEREALWRRVLAADVLSEAEKRVALGYTPDRRNADG